MKRVLITLAILIALMPFAYKGARYVYNYYLHYKANKLEGAKVEKIEVFDTDGKKYNFNKLKDKKVVLVFWASWCKYCIDEIPYIKEFYKNKKDDTLLITASIDKDKNSAIDAVKKYSMNYPVVIKSTQNSHFFSYFTTTQVPSIWVIDKSGKIVAHNLLHISDAQKILEKL